MIYSTSLALDYVTFSVAVSTQISYQVSTVSTQADIKLRSVAAGEGEKLHRCGEAELVQLWP